MDDWRKVTRDKSDTNNMLKTKCGRTSQEALDHTEQKYVWHLKRTIVREPVSAAVYFNITLTRKNDCQWASRLRRNEELLYSR